MARFWTGADTGPKSLASYLASNILAGTGQVWPCAGHSWKISPALQSTSSQPSGWRLECLRDGPSNRRDCLSWVREFLAENGERAGAYPRSQTFCSRPSRSIRAAARFMVRSHFASTKQKTSEQPCALHLADRTWLMGSEFMRSTQTCRIPNVRLNRRRRGVAQPPRPPCAGVPSLWAPKDRARGLL